MRDFRSFSYRGAHCRINGEAFDAATGELVRLRRELERYGREHPLFLSSLVPLPSLPGSPPESARRMHAASAAAGVGPMAAVAGTFAAMAAEAALARGCAEAVVENGGDIYMKLTGELAVALFPGAADSSRFQDLAFRIRPEETPLAVCSSSSKMGHSLSFGRADLVTVFSKDASLADAAATRGANEVNGEEFIKDAAEKIAAIDGVLGVLVIAGEKIAMAGTLPELVRHADPALSLRVSRDENSGFPLRPSRGP